MENPALSRISKPNSPKGFVLSGKLGQKHCEPVDEEGEKEKNKSSMMEALNQSDYKNFLQRSLQSNHTDFPSCFQYIKINDSRQGGKMIDDINFPTLECTKWELIEHTVCIIMKYDVGLLNTKHLTKLVTEIALGYKNISYHNFSHAFSLIQLFYICLNLDCSFRNLFSKEEITFCFLAGISHDMYHNGTNNHFQIKIQSQLSRIGQNDAVLEKMHIRSLFQLLNANPKLDIVSKSSKPKQFKQLLTRLIIATDISRHFANLKKFTSSRNQFDFTCDEDRYFVLEQVFHACDIGNPCLEYNQYISWASLLSYEFNEQFKLEKEKGLEVTEMFRYKGKKAFLDGQLSFINGLVLPQWKELSSVWSGFVILMKGIKQNEEELKKKRQIQNEA